MSVVAAHEALAQAALPPDLDPARKAMYVATGDLERIGLDWLVPATREAARADGTIAEGETLNRAACDRVSPFFLLESLMNNPTSFLTAAFGFMGSGTSLAAQSPCGSDALELAFRAVRTGRADAAVAVGNNVWTSAVAAASESRVN